MSLNSERPGADVVPDEAREAWRGIDLWNLAVYLLIAAFVLTVPVWSYSVKWGDHPSELIGMALIGVLLRILVRREP